VMTVHGDAPARREGGVGIAGGRSGERVATERVALAKSCPAAGDDAGVYRRAAEAAIFGATRTGSG
jgi:hypothetical protein